MILGDFDVPMGGVALVIGLADCWVSIRTWRRRERELKQFFKDQHAKLDQEIAMIHLRNAERWRRAATQPEVRQ